MKYSAINLTTTAPEPKPKGIYHITFTLQNYYHRNFKIITLCILTFNDVSVMCNNSTDCDDGHFCHIPDGELEGECHTQVTLTAYIQESINNLTTTTPKPKPKGVYSILFTLLGLICK